MSNASEYHDEYGSRATVRYGTYLEDVEEEYDQEPTTPLPRWDPPRERRWQHRHQDRDRRSSVDTERSQRSQAPVRPPNSEYLEELENRVFRWSAEQVLGINRTARESEVSRIIRNQNRQSSRRRNNRNRQREQEYDTERRDRDRDRNRDRQSPRRTREPERDRIREQSYDDGDRNIRRSHPRRRRHSETHHSQERRYSNDSERYVETHHIIERGRPGNVVREEWEFESWRPARPRRQFYHTHHSHRGNEDC